MGGGGGGTSTTLPAIPAWMQPAIRQTVGNVADLQKFFLGSGPIGFNPGSNPQVNLGRAGSSGLPGMQFATMNSRAGDPYDPEPRPDPNFPPTHDPDTGEPLEGVNRMSQNPILQFDPKRVAGLNEYLSGAGSGINAWGGLTGQENEAGALARGGMGKTGLFDPEKMALEMGSYGDKWRESGIGQDWSEAQAVAKERYMEDRDLEGKMGKAQEIFNRTMGEKIRNSMAKQGLSASGLNTMAQSDAFANSYFLPLTTEHERQKDAANESYVRTLMEKGGSELAADQYYRNLAVQTGMEAGGRLSDRDKFYRGLGIDTALRLGGTEAERGLQKIGLQTQYGNMLRGIEQQGNEEDYNEKLRLQALMEQSLYAPFGGFVPTTIGQRTTSSGGGGLFKS